MRAFSSGESKAKVLALLGLVLLTGGCEWDNQYQADMVQRGLLNWSNQMHDARQRSLDRSHEFQMRLLPTRVEHSGTIDHNVTVRRR